MNFSRTKFESEATAAPVGVVAVSSQLMDGVAITEAARRLGIRITLTNSERALATVRRDSPRQVLLDLTEPGVLALLESGGLNDVRTIGYYPHVDRPLRERALRAGLGRAVPRSAFFGRLSEWIAPPAPERLPEPPGGC